MNCSLQFCVALHQIVPTWAKTERLQTRLSLYSQRHRNECRVCRCDVFSVIPHQRSTLRNRMCARSLRCSIRPQGCSSDWKRDQFVVILVLKFKNLFHNLFKWFRLLCFAYQMSLLDFSMTLYLTFWIWMPKNTIPIAKKCYLWLGLHGFSSSWRKWWFFWSVGLFSFTDLAWSLGSVSLSSNPDHGFPALASFSVEEIHQSSNLGPEVGATGEDRVRHTPYQQLIVVHRK